MMANALILCLDEKERQRLMSIVGKGVHPVRTVNRARILLFSEQGYTAEEIGTMVQLSQSTVNNVRRRFIMEGLDRALWDLPRPGKPKKIFCKEEAIITTIATSEAPDGHARWTLQMIADRTVELTDLDYLSKETVSQVLKKVNLNPGKIFSGVLAR